MVDNHYLEEWFRRKWHLPVVPFNHPDINPFLDKGVDFSGVLGCDLPGGSMKVLGALGLLDGAMKQGLIVPGKTELVESSSGAMLRALRNVARSDPYLCKAVHGFMRQDAPLVKEYAARYAGASVTKVPGGTNPFEVTKKMAAENGWLHLNQYENPDNAMWYRDWAAEQVAKQVSDINLFVVAVGTGGTGIGFKQGLQRYFPDVTMIGAMCAAGHEIPGMRDEDGMGMVKLPWASTFPVENRVYVEAEPARLGAAWSHWAMTVQSGLSGGATLAAALMIVHKLDVSGELEFFRSRMDGRVHVVFVIHDGAWAYYPDRLPMLHERHQNPETAPKLWELLWAA